MKTFTESGVLFPDGWEDEPEESVLPSMPEPAYDDGVKDGAQRLARTRGTEEDDASGEGTPCLKRADLVEMLCAKHGLELSESRAYVAKFFDVIFAHLADGHQVKLSGLGKFSLRLKAPRPARNPWTGDAVMIEERTVVCYQSSDTLNSRISESLGETNKTSTMPEKDGRIP